MGSVLPASRRARSPALSLLFLSALLSIAAPTADAGTVLENVKSRGSLRCGVSEGIPGFSAPDASGRWQGFDADFCRAVAAAVLGDGERVEFVPLRAAARFPALQAGRIDLLARNTSWTFTREAVLGVQFPGVLLHDGQGFMVPADSGVTTDADLDGATICVERGTTHLRNLKDHANRRRLTLTPLILEGAPEAAAAFREGRCQAYSSDAAQLAAARSRLPGGIPAFRILPERISQEILAPAVWGGDAQWALIVRWVLNALILAEQHGATGATLEQVLAAGQTPLSRLTEDERGQIARTLGLTLGWARRAVLAVGNYGELFERHLGPASPLGLERGPNRLWNQGGLLHAPPFD